MTSNTGKGMHSSAFMCKVFRVHFKFHKHILITMDHLTNAKKPSNPQRLPTTQASPRPWALLVFSSTNYNASPAIQANLPGSLDAILLLAIAAFNQYFLAEWFYHKCRSISNSTIWSLSLSYSRVTLHLVYIRNLNKIQEESMNFSCYIGILDQTVDKLFKRSLVFLSLISLQLAGIVL